MPLSVWRIKCFAFEKYEGVSTIIKQEFKQVTGMNNEAEISSSVNPDGVGGKRKGRAGFTTNYEKIYAKI